MSDKLTEDKFERLNDMLTAISLQEGAMNDWERSFIQSQLERVEKYGAGVFMSPKQWSMIEKIYTAVTGDGGKANEPEDPGLDDEIPF